MPTKKQQTAYQKAQRWGILSTKLRRLETALAEQREWNTRKHLTAMLDVLREIEGWPIEIEVEVPRCWKDLVDVTFDEGDNHELYWFADGDEGRLVTDARSSRKTLDDPAPYYDDHREVTGKNYDGWRAEVHLCSGQGNYWGEFHIYNPDGECVYDSESDPCEDFEDENEITLFRQDDGTLGSTPGKLGRSSSRSVLVKIKWTAG